MSLLLAIKSGFGFLSTIPVGITMEGINALMEKLYVYTIVGSLLGLIIGVFSFFVGIIFPAPLTVILIIGIIYYLTWFNHLDGVADMGDGMTAHGNLEKKRKVLKDMAVGVGGVASVAIVLLALFSSIASLENVSALMTLNFVSNSEIYLIGPVIYFFSGYFSEQILNPVLVQSLILGSSLAVSEMNAKHSMVTIATFGKSFQEGLGSMTIEGGTPKNFAIGSVYTIIVSFLFLGVTGLIATAFSVLSALVVLRTSNHHFGGLNGDGIGVSNEVGRVASIATIAIVFYITLGGVI